MTAKRRALAIVLLAVLATAPLSLGVNMAGAAPTPESGYSFDTLATGFDVPTTLAFLPDGRILVAEKAGVVRLLDDGWISSTPVLDINDRVSDYSDRGLLGMTVDPDFATNGYIYLSYTYEHDASDPTGPKSGRIVRYTMNGDVADVASAHVLVGSVAASPCPANADCIPNDGISHIMGDLVFGADGFLYASLGEAAYPTSTVNVRAQDPAALAGKILRIDRDGNGVASNPFFTGDPSDNASKVYAVGLRNAFRLTVDAATGAIWAGDVGWEAYEEIDLVSSGANYGWPCYEGPSMVPDTDAWGVGAAIRATPTCQSMYASPPSSLAFPFIALAREPDQAATVVIGSVAGPQWGSLSGRLLVADYVWGWIKGFDVSGDGAPPTTVGTGQGIVDVVTGPDGLAYILDIWTGTIERLRPSSVALAPPCPVGTWTEDIESGADSATGCVYDLDFDWGVSAPAGMVGVDGWSGRWRSSLEVPSGVYDVRVDTSEHVRVHVDDAVVLERWSEASEVTTLTSRVTLTSGRHRVQVELLDAADSASLDLTLVPVASAGTTYISDLPFVEETNGWGPVERDESNGGSGAQDGGQLLAGGQTFTKGLGVHAPSSVRVVVPAGCHHFDATVGVDDGTGSSGSVVFEARDAGANASSPLLTGDDGTVALGLAVVSGTELELLVANGGDNNYYDAAAWGDARFTCGGTPSVSIEGAPASVAPGQSLSVTAVGTAADGTPLPENELSWEVIVHHCAVGQCHQHLLTTALGPDLTLAVPDHGGDDWTLELRVTATSGGEAATSSAFVSADNSPPAAVPEGSTIALFATTSVAMLAVAIVHRRQRRPAVTVGDR